MIDVAKQVEKIDYAIKDNNDWFYDRPNEKETIEATCKYAQAYFKIAPKWLSLNSALMLSRDTITEMLAAMREQDKEIKRLRSILSDNDIEIEETVKETR
jgi:hypothetical protein